MTNGILSTIEDWTGARPDTCPWRAFFDPFVGRVMSAYNGFFESGQLSYVVPRPSHRLVSGVAYLHRCISAIHAQQRKMDREKAERDREARRHG